MEQIAVRADERDGPVDLAQIPLRGGSGLRSGFFRAEAASVQVAGDRAKL